MTVIIASFGIFGMVVCVVSYAFLCFGALYIEANRKRFPAYAGEFKGAMMFTRGLSVFTLVPLIVSFVLVGSWGVRLPIFSLEVVAALASFASVICLMVIWGKAVLHQVYIARTEPQSDAQPHEVGV